MVEVAWRDRERIFGGENIWYNHILQTRFAAAGCETHRAPVYSSVKWEWMLVIPTS